MKGLSLCVLVLTVATLAAAVEPARACSCIPPDPWSFLEQADGAFVGRLDGRREDGQGRAVLLFDVERAVKGRLGATVEVVTASSGSSCGIETTVGRRIGLFLVREGDKWFGHLCGQVEPEDLLAAASLPAPNGRGPVALFVGGRFGPARTLALDAKGRTLAYGLGGGTIKQVSVCPGGSRLAELAHVPTGTLVIRQTGTLRIVRRQAVVLPGRRYVQRLKCENGSGASVVAFARWPLGDSPTKAALYRLRKGRIEALWSGAAFDATITSSAAYLSAGTSGRTVLRVDLLDGQIRRVATLPAALTSMALNRAGTILAGIGVESPGQIVRVDLARPAKVKTVRFAGREAYGQVFCLPTGNVVVVSAYGDAPARVLDASLRTWSYFRWTAGPAALVGSRLFGIDHTRSLFRAELPSGPMRVVRQLPGRPTVIVSATP